MSNFDDLKATLAGIATDVSSVQAVVSNQQSTITALQQQIANSGTTLPPDAQASLDAVEQQATTIKSALDTMVTSLNTAAAPAATKPTG